MNFFRFLLLPNDLFEAHFGLLQESLGGLFSHDFLVGVRVVLSTVGHGFLLCLVGGATDLSCRDLLTVRVAAGAPHDQRQVFYDFFGLLKLELEE